VRTLPNESRQAPVRRCILTGERADQAMLIRLAISPDGLVLPDVMGKAPGRGAWLGANRAELEEAMAKGRLRGALARAFKGSPLSIPDDLPERIAAGLERATLDRLGLEARSGFLLTGSEKIATALRSGEASALFHAADSSPDGRGKLAQAWRVGRDREGSGDTGVVLPVDRQALSMALGRQNAVHIALLGQGAAERVLHHLERWLNYIGCSKATRHGEKAAVDVSTASFVTHGSEGSGLFDE